MMAHISHYHILWLLGLIIYLHGLKFPALEVETVTWQDQKLLVFNFADWSSTITVKNLAYLLDSPNSRAVTLQKRYKSEFSQKLGPYDFGVFVNWLISHLREGHITEATSRTFLLLNYWDGSKALNTSLKRPRSCEYLSSLIPLWGSFQKWSVYPTAFIRNLLESAPEDPAAEFTLQRARNSSILRFRLSKYMVSPKRFLFLLDFKNISQIDKNIEEDIISDVFEAPASIEDMVRNLVYMVHFILCTSSRNMVHINSAEINIPSLSMTRIHVSNMIEIYSVVKKPQDVLDEEIIVQRRVLKFIETFMDLLTVCECFAKGQSEGICAFTWRSPKGFFHSLLEYTNPERLAISRTGRCRLNFGFIALAFLERDMSRKYIRVDKSPMRRLISFIFRCPDDIAVKDLIMCLIVVADYSQYYLDAKEVLKWIMEEVNQSDRLALGVLQSESVQTFAKMMLTFKWRKRHFQFEMEASHITILNPTRFLAPDHPEVRRTEGPYTKQAFLRYQRMLDEKSDVLESESPFDLSDVEFTKQFLSNFLCHFLTENFLATIEQGQAVFHRPNLQTRNEIVMMILRQALQTAIVLRIEYNQKVRFGIRLMEFIQNAWSVRGSNLFTSDEFHAVLTRAA